MGKIFFNIVLIILVLLLICTVWPFITRTRINYDVKKAATYGTKHSIEETRRLLTKALKEKGVSFNPDGLVIKKTMNDTVTISLEYEDSIHFLSIDLKRLEFKLHAKEENVKEYF